MQLSSTSPTLDDERWFSAYDVIMSFVESGRHSISADLLHKMDAGLWFKKRGLSLKDLVRTSIQAQSLASYTEINTVIIDIQAPEGGIISKESNVFSVRPLDAIRYLSQPHHVVVENELYDGAFLLWMAKAAGLSKFLHAYRDGLFIFRHAGGKGGLIRCAQVLSSGVLEASVYNQWRGMRMWASAFLDSDSKHASDYPNYQILKGLEQNVCFATILQRRSIENYLPPSYILKRSPDKLTLRKISALNRMTDDQRRFYNMKNGFQRYRERFERKSTFMNSAEVSMQEKFLFTTLSDGDFEILKDGFGDGLSDIYIQVATRESTNDISLTSSADRAEIKTLCQSILQRL